MQRSEIFLTCLACLSFSTVAEWHIYHDTFFLLRFRTGTNLSPLTFCLPSHQLENRPLLAWFYMFKIAQEFGLLTSFYLCSIFPLKRCPQLHKRYPYFTCQVPASQQMPSCPITNDDYTRGHCWRLTVISLTQ